MVSPTAFPVEGEAIEEVVRLGQRRMLDAQGISEFGSRPEATESSGNTVTSGSVGAFESKKL